MEHHKNQLFHHSVHHQKQPPFSLKHLSAITLAIAASPLFWSGNVQAADLFIEGGTGGSAITATGDGTNPNAGTYSAGATASIDDTITGSAATGGDGALISGTGLSSQNSADDVHVTTNGSHETSTGTAGVNDFGQGTANSGTNGIASGSGTAQGGNGGNADLVLSGTQTFDSINIVGGQAGSASGYGAIGGAGGTVNFTVNGDLIVSDDINIDAGAGGLTGSYREPANQGGAGGRGGDVIFTINGSLNAGGGDDISLYGGMGGMATNSTEAAGSGGDLILNVQRDLHADTFYIEGGYGGEASDLTGGTGGHGGNINIHVAQSAIVADLVINNGEVGLGTPNAQGGNSGNVTMTVNGTLNATSLTLDAWHSHVAADNNGHSGQLTLNVGTLITEDGNFHQENNNDGEIGNNLAVNVGTLLVLPNTVSSLHFYQNNPATMVFNTIQLTENSTMDVWEDDGGGFSFNTLRVSGLNATYDTSTGTSSTLNAQNKSLVFDLPGTIVAGDVMLYAPNGIQVDGANVTLTAAAGVPSLSIGDAVTLIDNTTGTVGNSGVQSVFYGATEYNFDIQNSANSLLARLVEKEIPIDPDTGKADGSAKAYAEGLLAPTLSLNSSTDAIAGTGLMYAEMADISGKHLFVNASGSHIKGNTGSHITSDNFHLLAGVSFGLETDAGKIIIAPFAEYGRGDYDTYNSFGTSSVSGNGDLKHWGAGVMGQYRMDNGIYLDGSVRAGRIKSDFSSSDMGWGAQYDTRSNYYGAHIGAGYQMDLAQNHHLDTYAKLLWTHQDGDDFYTRAAERVDYDAIDSLRTRLGARYHYDLQTNAQIMLGAAWEYEMDGKLHSRISAVPIEEPSLRGHTGIIEAGLNWQPAPNWNVRINAFGLAGQREGGGGSVNIDFRF